MGGHSSWTKPSIFDELFSKQLTKLKRQSHNYFVEYISKAYQALTGPIITLGLWIPAELEFELPFHCVFHCEMDMIPFRQISLNFVFDEFHRS
ncbi:hypothetical protein L2E82_25338 [Cichorium intybus]|uniref:Uncharacterized protein n=1 Tax=Cichorium intybus TaxID=13427 RepID=A0ACB9E308_CICIN|nr:hypothetical protein L2E82_25338 [Cichorium intybus]